MCNPSHNHPNFSKSHEVRFGSCLEHGEAHTLDHARWSRRDFLTSLGLVAAGSTLVMQGTPMRVFGQTPLLKHLQQVETDRVLVLIQMSGGNDGLNTIIPKTNDLYYNARPQLAIPASEISFALNDDLGVHPAFNTLTPVYSEGHMAVLQNVGYPEPDLSHFRSTDIWISANPDDEYADTGWLGRYLDAEFPTFTEESPGYPLAVQMGGIGSTLVQGPSANMGMSLANAEIFQQLIEEGILYTTDNLPQTTYGQEMEFVRSVANDAFTYAEAIQTAATTGPNEVTYPGSTFAGNLAAVAQLIKGQLGARIYHVTISGFDTHANQGGANGAHANLLGELASTVDAFLRDLDAGGHGDRVLVMTFSEFGRRVFQNGSGGTDHGSAAPLFLFGHGLNGGLYGHAPDLTNLDADGDGIGDGIAVGEPGSQGANLAYNIDYRAVYATVLQDWFGLPAATVQSILGDTFEPLGFVSQPVLPTATEDAASVPQSFILHQNYPNPFNPSTTISYDLTRAEHVALRIYDVQGRLVQTLVDGVQPAGTHSFSFDAGHLPSGTYFYRLHTGHDVQTRQMVLLR